MFIKGHVRLATPPHGNVPVGHICAESVVEYGAKVNISGNDDGQCYASGRNFNLYTFTLSDRRKANPGFTNSPFNVLATGTPLFLSRLREVLDRSNNISTLNNQYL